MTHVRTHALVAALVLACACSADPIAPGAAPAPTAANAGEGPSASRPEIGTARRARDGSLRFADEAVHDHPEAAVELLRRFDAETAAEVRVALVEALPRTGGEWVDAVLARFPREPEPSVRKAMVSIAARAVEGAAALVELGLGDEDASVRAEAAMAAASVRVGGAKLAGALAALLADRDARVRASAARSLALAGYTARLDRFAAIAPLLDDSAATVRLEAVRALGRIDGARAATLPALRARQSDGDVKVAAAARRIVEAAAGHEAP